MQFNKYTHTHTHTHTRGYVQFNKYTHTHTLSLIPPREDQCEWHRMTRMTGPDCVVMCNLINTGPDCVVMCNLINTHTHTQRGALAITGGTTCASRLTLRQQKSKARARYKMYKPCNRPRRPQKTQCPSRHEEGPLAKCVECAPREIRKDMLRTKHSTFRYRYIILLIGPC